jgi:hypothetical protein
MMHRMRMRRNALPLFALLACGACGGTRDDVSGTYLLDRSGGAGCVLGARLDEPRAVHLEVQCTAPGAAQTKGDLVTMAAVDDGKAVVRMDDFGAPCELRFHFRGSTAVVTQPGSAEACGFPPGVVLAGTWRRTSRDPWVLPELR